MLYAARRDANVETSALGEFAPSLRRNTGSAPLLLSNRSCRLSGPIDQPFAGSWHVKQVRPLVPRLCVNVAVRFVKPLTLYVRAMPSSFGKFLLLRMLLLPANVSGSAFESNEVVQD